jgi:hypothetical protein
VTADVSHAGQEFPLAHCSDGTRNMTHSRAISSSPLATSRCVQAIQSHLLPSLRRMIGACFFAEGVNSLHASPSVSICACVMLCWIIASCAKAEVFP